MGDIEQFASKVVNFSSQYGTAMSSSYTASNLASGPHIFPNYGDYTDAFVLRTYGPWWQCCPSARKRFRHQPGSSQDFVELQFDICVVPTSIHIYETYHPGAVVKILACNADLKEKMAKRSGEVEWVTLWSGSPQCHSVPKQSRIFSPGIRKIDFATNLIRLEFNSENCQYYTELDAVKLIGVIPKCNKTRKDRRDGFHVSLTTKLIKQLSLTDRQASINAEDDDSEKWGYFGILPDEVIQHIFQYLDSISLAKVAQTCSLLLKNSYDPLLHRELNLQSHWNNIDDVALESIAPRCSSLQHLNLSWTGGGGQVTEMSFCSFIKYCGQQLLTLQLACCQYVGNSAMTTICEVCFNLEVLDLSCVCIDEQSLLPLARLVQLKYLNLYSIKLSQAVLHAISKLSCLEHLNIGACAINSQSDALQLETALNDCLKGLPRLISLDLWRCKFVSPKTLNVLSNCSQNIQELDVGWCRKVTSEFWDPVNFLSKCCRLKKLFLTCGRAVSDYHLQEIAKHCHELEQLDILGSNMVTMKGVSEICQKCRKLSFFDVSFCTQIKEENLESLSKMYPNVCFKKSFN